MHLNLNIDHFLLIFLDQKQTYLHTTTWINQSRQEHHTAFRTTSLCHSVSLVQLKHVKIKQQNGEIIILSENA